MKRPPAVSDEGDDEVDTEETVHKAQLYFVKVVALTAAFFFLYWMYQMLERTFPATMHSPIVEVVALAALFLFVWYLLKFRMVDFGGW